MIHGSTILTQRQARRLYGGCPPCLLYHANNLKSMGENEMAQSWQKAVSRSPPQTDYFNCVKNAEILSLSDFIIFTLRSISAFSFLSQEMR